MTSLDVAILLSAGRDTLKRFHRLQGTLGTRQDLLRLADKLEVATKDALRNRMKRKARKLLEEINAALVVDGFVRAATLESFRSNTYRGANIQNLPRNYDGRYYDGDDR
jgi:hypothetical protein